MKTIGAFSTICLFALLSGCASTDTTQNSPTPTQQQDAILNDPMGYKPNPPRDISGGDITHFDHDGFNKDLNDALNP